MFSIVLGLAIIIGGFASAANATDVQDEYLDKLHCSIPADFPTYKYPGIHNPQKLCENLQYLKKHQVVSAVSSDDYIILSIIISLAIHECIPGARIQGGQRGQLPPS